MAELKIATVCPRMRLANSRKNLERVGYWAEKAAAAAANLLFLPETFITGYATESMYEAGYASKETFLGLAEPLPGPSVERLEEISHAFGLFICVGILERDDAHYYNSQVLICPEEGYRGKYRKVQVGSTERWFSRPGDQFPVFDVAGFPTGIMICRDKSHPEIARILALEGAQLLLNPHCTPGNTFTSWSLRLCTARAQENGCYLIANNPVFDCPLDPVEQDGHLFAIDPYGELLSCTQGEGCDEKFEIIEVDTNVVQRRRDMEGVDFNLYSRLPEHYGRLVRTDSISR